jgi:hypothetical protein
MQIGFVNFNTEEKKRVSKMMQLLQESEAIEELGTGRVRDHFSNTLFPGTSTLQHHAKYFAILPSLYYEAAYHGKRFNSVREVEKYIIEAEVQITRQLAEHEGQVSMTGITGINTYREALNDYRKYVKYNPTYIYGSGMATYGMVPDTSIYQLILEISKTTADNPHNKRWLKGEDLTEDAQNEMIGEKPLILHSEQEYDFFNGISMPMTMTPAEALFVKKKILESPYCQGTLLHFLLDEKNQFVLTDDVTYYDLGFQLSGIDEGTKDVYDKSVLFSKLIHLIDWSFNHAYYTSFGNDEQEEYCKQAFEKLFQYHKESLENSYKYRSLFDYTRGLDLWLTEFCESCYDVILEKGTACLKELDGMVARRERTVKRERSKIGNSSYRNKMRLDPGCNIFRWVTVRTMVNEIRNPQ